MASAEQLKALLKSHMSGDDAQFFSVAMQVAAHEARLGHGKLAEELRALIDQAKTRSSTDALSRKAVPIVQPRGELANLLEASFPKARLSDMVLDNLIESRLKRIIKEQRHFAKIREHGLSPRRKLLLVGPPGTGKTLTALVLAGELGIPLFLVRLDALITKYMGDSEPSSYAKCSMMMFLDRRASYFFDEVFNASARQRGFDQRYRRNSASAEQLPSDARTRSVKQHDYRSDQPSGYSTADAVSSVRRCGRIRFAESRSGNRTAEDQAAFLQSAGSGLGTPCRPCEWSSYDGRWRRGSSHQRRDHS